MPALPDGEPVGPDGPLDPDQRLAVGGSGFGVYLHVPFCRVRCGYCDFNTYTADELGGETGPAQYLRAVAGEVSLAAGLLGPQPPAVSTVFVGGGTPTLLGAQPLADLLAVIGESFPTAPDAEVTVEANPDSVTPADLARLAEAGVTRVSFGVQSVVPRVLAALDRTHDPARVPAVLRAARRVGLHTSVDLIYGAPGETPEEWRRSVEAAIDWQPDHLSAYALVVEPGTRLAGQVRRGEVTAPDDDQLADSYLLVDALLADAGYDWYEVSNWSRDPAARCRHNLGYWRGQDWWGLGPGAHSHVAGVRWWNVKHPARYASLIAAGGWPAAGRERLTDTQRRTEQVLLGIRLAAGLPLAEAGPAAVTAELTADGLLDADAAASGRAVLTTRGRLLADGVARILLADPS
jgi:oxygen-independent coproporphyrinogen-3 oxidase